MRSAPEQLRGAPSVRDSATAAPGSGAAPISEIARGSTLNLAGVILLAAVTLGLTVVVTRSFSRSAAGAFFAATSLFLILEATTGLGAENGLVFFIAGERSVGEDRIPGLLRSAIVPVIVASIATAALLVAFAGPLARTLEAGGKLGDASPTAIADALRALAAALPFAALLDTLLGATRGYRDMRPTVAIDRVGRSCLQLAGALIAALVGSAALLAPLWALAYVPSAVVAWLWLARIRSRSRVGAGRQPSAGPASAFKSTGFWRYTAPRALATCAQIIIQRLDIVLVGIMRGLAAAAVYTAATRFLVVGQLGNAAIGMAAQPQLSSLFARRDVRSANTVYQATTAWLVLLTWPLYLLAINYGPAVLSIFGASYRSGSTVIVIIGGSMLLASGCGLVDIVLTSTGRSALSLANGVAALALNVGLDIILIPRYGITGAAVGWAAAITVSNLLPLAQVARIVHVHPFGSGTFRAIVLAAVSFGAIPVLVGVLFGRGPAASIIAVAVGCVVAAAGVWGWREQLQLSTIARPRLQDRGFSTGFLTGSHSHPEVT